MSDNLRGIIQDVLDTKKPVPLDTACDLYEAAEKLIAEIEDKLPSLQDRCDALKAACEAAWAAYRQRQSNRKQYLEAKTAYEAAFGELNLRKTQLHFLCDQRKIALKSIEVKDHGNN